MNILSPSSGSKSESNKRQVKCLYLLLFYSAGSHPEDEGKEVHRNVCKLVPDCTTLYTTLHGHRRQNLESHIFSFVKKKVDVGKS
jgi:hypothetical protein